MALPEPITREEMFLNAAAQGGGNLPEPVTREEMYLNKAATGSGSIPSEPITREEMYLEALAQGGGGGGGDVSVVPLTVTDNGVYTAPSGKAYSPVTVSIPTATGVTF